MQIGSFAEVLGSPSEAEAAYNCALRANPNSVAAMNAISLILRTREDFQKAVDYLQDILKLEPSNGEAWGSLGKSSLPCTPAIAEPVSLTMTSQATASS